MTGRPEDDAFLVIAPSGRDAQVIGELLASAGLSWRADHDGEALLAALIAGDTAGAIVTDDALSRIDSAQLREALDRQPPWSDFPFVLLSRRGETRQGSRSLEELVNVTILERPLHPASLISAARAARRGRRRQRLAAQHLADLETARAQLRELADTLEAKVADRTRDLAAANDRLTAEIAERERAEARLVQAQKMEAVGQLTGGIAHDFNNLLTAVVGSLDLLLRRTDDEKLRRLAGNALQAAERGARLTAQLLAFSRRQRLSPTPLQPNDIISGMGDLLARTIGRHVRVETRLEPNLWQALADPTQLEVMILNLAINARDAMPAGGRLTIATANQESVPPALAGELAPGEYVALSVSDTGTGMSPAVLARAFEPFFTTKEQGKGTGLGLAQLYGFARQSGGTARIETCEGEGTTVTIYLPRTEQARETAQPAYLEVRPRPRTRILVVDDDDDVRLVAAAMIEELGYEVEAANGGDAALKALEADGFALLLTDVAMPGINGVELARRVRELRPDLPVVFATGYADFQTFGASLSDERLLKKPYRIAEVAALISEALAEAPPGGNVVELRRP
ncbi:response regulator [Sphingomonas parva]|uniref:histidine kinase n=1 Tax=Sphingomonas parva TaxID=2555898 RepID=A0A4Y8ZUH9_9SPHN|nr:response regulator [Sphingomonas parva]TFI58116.1 response regulator [Sphingomonas parva]